MITGFDIFSLIVVFFCAMRAMHRGFISEVFGFGALLGGVSAATLLSGRVSGILDAFIAQPIWSRIVSFLVVFVLVYILAKSIHRFLANVLQRANLINLDRALGFCLGIAESIVLLVIVVLLLQIVPFLDGDALLADSIVVSYINPIASAALDLLRY